MKVKCIKKTERTDSPSSFQIHFGDVIYGEIYNVISIENDWYRIIDVYGEEYLYPPELFEIYKGVIKWELIYVNMEIII